MEVGLPLEVPVILVAVSAKSGAIFELLTGGAAKMNNRSVGEQGLILLAWLRRLRNV